MPLVSVSLLTYNGQRFIRNCLNSVLNQTYPKIELLIIDNDSQDETFNIAKEVIGKHRLKFPIRLLKNERNLGFARGHNLGIAQGRGEFILCLNQDVILAPDFIAKAVDCLAKPENKKVGALQGKLLRLDFQLRPTNIIDTTGLAIFKNRRIVNRGQGQIDKGQFEETEEVFGADGAAPVYRKEALEDTKVSVIFMYQLASNQRYEYFDEDFFAYKEDVDLAWRLRLRGWKIIYFPEAKGYHWRGAGDSAATDYLAIIKERRKIGKFAKYLAFKNQRLMQIKNELPCLFFKHLPWFLPKEIASWIYVILFERNTWKAIRDFFRQLPSVWKKRKIIMNSRKIKTKELEKWFI